MHDLIAQLKNTPNTPITSGQLAALLEAVLTHQQTQARTQEGQDWNSLPDDRELTTEELGQWLRKAPNTLAKLRVKGTGPAYKPGKPVIYKVGDVRQWLASRRVNSTSEATVRGIHRFDSIADLTPMFTFECLTIPLGIENSLDYQDLHPEAKIKQVSFFNLDNVIQMKKNNEFSFFDDFSLSEQVGALLIAAGCCFANDEENLFHGLLSLIEELKNSGKDIHKICTTEGDTPTHVIVRITRQIFITYELETEEWKDCYDKSAVKAMQQLSDLGFDLNATNNHGQRAVDLAPDDSHLKVWLTANAEKDDFFDNVPTSEKPTKKIRPFGL